jgi:hypothetical protein
LTALLGNGKQQYQGDVRVASKEGAGDGPCPTANDVTGRGRRIVRGGNSHSNSKLLKLCVALGEDKRREITKRAKRGAKGMHHLKGSNIQAVMDDDFVTLLQKECTQCGKGTLAGVRGAIIEELLPIRQTREREELTNQRDDWRGRDVDLTPHQTVGGVRRLHQKNCQRQQSAMSKANGKVNNNHQNNGTGNAGKGRINVYCDCS